MAQAAPRNMGIATERQSVRRSRVFRSRTTMNSQGRRAFPEGGQHPRLEDGPQLRLRDLPRHVLPHAAAMAQDFQQIHTEHLLIL